MAINAPIVNRWTDFDPLEEVILGIADDACFPPLEPSCQSEYNDQYTKYGATMSHPISDYVPWPTGPKLKKFINGANKELEGTIEGKFWLLAPSRVTWRIELSLAREMILTCD